jgi:EAL domain-containing protein (putative c-di-GMP-specific phosphodiesterase class I)
MSPGAILWCLQGEPARKSCSSFSMPSPTICAVAAETGLIVPSGRWAFREACRQGKEWVELFPSDPPLSMSVNVSGKLVMQNDMVARVWQILKKTRIPTGSLRLEIAENGVFVHGGVALEKLSRLRWPGEQFSIDDRGTGYSSLS